MKRGQALTLGLLVLMGFVVIGSISSVRLLSEHRWVGNPITQEYYDLSKCALNISESELIHFENENEAKSGGFKSAQCNR